MKKADIEKILKDRFIHQWVGSVRWTNQDVTLAIIEVVNEFLQEEAINQSKK